MSTPPKPAEYFVVYTDTAKSKELEAKHGIWGFDPADTTAYADAKTLSDARKLARQLLKGGHLPHHIKQITDLRLEQHYGDIGESWLWDEAEIVEEL